LKEWQFKQMKRWAASAHQFTLEFGDYDDDYYVVFTEESNQIARVIVEYIDLSLRAMKRNHFSCSLSLLLSII
jgi:hypothetical protein